MLALRRLQEEFASALFGADSATVLMSGLECRDPDRAIAGLMAYRSSVLANLSAAVQTSYPVIGAIVGDEFMSAACSRYALSVPSTSGDLNLYGAGFDAFLADFAPAKSLPYLPAVARLEWQVQRVYGAQDVAEPDLQRLADTTAEYWGSLRFELDPAHALLASDWPIVTIWQVNQIGYEGDFTVDMGQAQCALVQRTPDGVTVVGVSRAESEFLRGLAANATLDQAVETACAIDDQFNLAEALQRHICSRLLRQAI